MEMLLNDENDWDGEVDCPEVMGPHCLIWEEQVAAAIKGLTMEQLGGRVADWRASLFGKGLKVNAGKSKVMVGSSGGTMIVNSGKWPCGVCGKGVQENSVQCTVCKKLFHKQCSGVRGELSRVADGFR